MSHASRLTSSQSLLSPAPPTDRTCCFRGVRCGRCTQWNRRSCLCRSSSRVSQRSSAFHRLLGLGFPAATLPTVDPFLQAVEYVLAVGVEIDQRGRLEAATRPWMTPINSMRLLVVSISAPASSREEPLTGCLRMYAQPPGPGLPSMRRRCRGNFDADGRRALCFGCHAMLHAKACSPQRHRDSEVKARDAKVKPRDEATTCRRHLSILPLRIFFCALVHLC